MRLFFLNRSRARSGFFRSAEDVQLSLYSKRVFTLKRNRKLFHIAFNLHTIEYSIKIGFIIFLIALTFGNSFFHTDYQKKELLLSNSKSEVIEKIEEKRLAYNIYLYKDGSIQLGPDLVNEKEIRLLILKDIFEMEPRMKAFLFIDKNTDMIHVYNLLEELKESGILSVHFATTPE